VFDQILGLPAHPLMVHAPVVLIPLTVLIAVAYALVLPLRERLGWILVLLSLAGAGSAWAAAQAGERLASLQPASAQLQAHGELGDMLWKLAVVLAVVSVVLVLVDASRRNRSWGNDAEDEYGYAQPRRSSGGLVLGAVSLVLTLGLLSAAGAAGVYVARTGHSGAQMVWGSNG
jgi:uncharacterized membrane protein